MKQEASLVRQLLVRLICRLRRSTKLFPLRQKDVFVRAWRDTLRTNAKLFNGLYAGLVRVGSGNAKTPQKALKEWYDRTRFKWEDGEITKLCEKSLCPVIERSNPDECASWAGLLLKAAEAAGLQREEEKHLVLNEQNANSYTEWNGKELYVGDTVEVMLPAWYQNGELIEQGICTLLTSGEE
ncbi:MAG: hypothetical protein IKQ45_00485 [Clostridia bacterium]|nr:hypothetical protein [Clostridia bacterium]